MPIVKLKIVFSSKLLKRLRVQPLAPDHPLAMTLSRLPRPLIKGQTNNPFPDRDDFAAIVRGDCPEFTDCLKDENDDLAMFIKACLANTTKASCKQLLEGEYWVTLATKQAEKQEWLNSGYSLEEIFDRIILAVAKKYSISRADAKVALMVQIQHRGAFSQSASQAAQYFSYGYSSFMSSDHAPTIVPDDKKYADQRHAEIEKEKHGFKITTRRHLFLCSNQQRNLESSIGYVQQTVVVKNETNSENIEDYIDECNDLELNLTLDTGNQAQAEVLDAIRQRLTQVGNNQIPPQQELAEYDQFSKQGPLHLSATIRLDAGHSQIKDFIDVVNSHPAFKVVAARYADLDKGAVAILEEILQDKALYKLFVKNVSAEKTAKLFVYVRAHHAEEAAPLFAFMFENCKKLMNNMYDLNCKKTPETRVVFADYIVWRDKNVKTVLANLKQCLGDSSLTYNDRKLQNIYCYIQAVHVLSLKNPGAMFENLKQLFLLLAKVKGSATGYLFKWIDKFYQFAIEKFAVDLNVNSQQFHQQQEETLHAFEGSQQGLLQELLQQVNRQQVQALSYKSNDENKQSALLGHLFHGIFSQSGPKTRADESLLVSHAIDARLGS